MKRHLPVLVALLALAGCNSGGAAPPPCGPVPQVVVAPPLLLSPQPGATGVATSGLVIDISYDPANDGTLRLVAGSGATLVGGAFASVGAGSPQPAGTAVATAPQLAAQTTYTVFVDAVYPPAGRCPVPGPSGPTSYQLGSFTTS